MRTRLRVLRRFLGSSKTQAGNIGQLMTTAVCVLFFISLLALFFRYASVIEKNFAVMTLSRSYMLQMEQDGYLTAENAEMLREELSKIGLEEIDLSGSTLSRTGYGTRIYLEIQGTLGETYAIHQLRTSTAKY